MDFNKYINSGECTLEDGTVSKISYTTSTLSKIGMDNFSEETGNGNDATELPGAFSSKKKSLLSKWSKSSVFHPPKSLPEMCAKKIQLKREMKEVKREEENLLCEKKLLEQKKKEMERRLAELLQSS